MNDPMSEKLHDLIDFGSTPIAQSENEGILQIILLLLVEETVTDNHGRTSGKRTTHRYLCSRELVQRINRWTENVLAGKIEPS